MGLVFLSVTLRGQERGIQEVFDNYHAELFSNCSFGALAVYEDGRKIAGVNQGRRLNPASNMKAITTAAALSRLGAGYRWETTIASCGPIDSQGTLKGDLYIIGGGDPMLGSNDKEAFPIDSTFTQWYEIIRKAGINEIEGSIVADGSWIEGMREEPSWCHDDLGTYYGTCASGLNFYENTIRMHANTMGMQQGQDFSLKAEYPQCPWMKWDFRCGVGAKGSGDRLYMYGSEFSDDAIVRGSYGAEKEGSVYFRNYNPERSLAWEFTLWLRDRGFGVGGEGIGVREASSQRSAHSNAEKITELGSTLSPDLQTVITRTNKDSNNLYAELLMRTLGREIMGKTDLDSSRKALETAVEQLCGQCLDEKQVHIQDGSGLSMMNRMSPEFICRVLRAVKNGKDFEAFRSSLVKYSSRCFYKTGSFTGCRCLCGYILPSKAEGETIIFSIMVNNSERGTSAIDREEKKLLEHLARLN